jgi:hypothetical protein
MPDHSLLAMTDRDLSTVTAAAAAVPYELRSRFLLALAHAASLVGAHDLPALATRLARVHAAMGAVMSSTGDDCERWEGDSPVEAVTGQEAEKSNPHASTAR